MGLFDGESRCDKIGETLVSCQSNTPVPAVASPECRSGDTPSGGAHNMARGRIISCSLSTSTKFYLLYKEAGPLAEFCQSLYPLLVIHSDDCGRFAGDAFTVKMKCHPASPRSLDEFETALEALRSVGMIERGIVDGVACLQIVAFDQHQSGLHKRTESKLPEVPRNSGGFRPELELEREGNRNGKGIESKGAAKNAAYSHEFLQFWERYPRKTSKGDAWKAWVKLSPPLSAVLDALSWQVNQPGWTKDEGQFVPYPASWLNARGWEDEVFHAPLDLTPRKGDTLGVHTAKTVMAVRVARGDDQTPRPDPHKALMAAALSGAFARP